MIVPVEDRMCPPGLEGVDSVKNLTRLYIPHMLTGRGSTISREEMDGGWDMPDQDPYLFSFSSMCPFQVLCFFRSRVQQDNGILVEINSPSPILVGCPFANSHR